jgi:hypothetical protein
MISCRQAGQSRPCGFGSSRTIEDRHAGLEFVLTKKRESVLSRNLLCGWKLTHRRETEYEAFEHFQDFLNDRRQVSANSGSPSDSLPLTHSVGHLPRFPCRSFLFRFLQRPLLVSVRGPGLFCNLRTTGADSKGHTTVTTVQAWNKCVFALSMKRQPRKKARQTFGRYWRISPQRSTRWSGSSTLRRRRGGTTCTGTTRGRGGRSWKCWTTSRPQTCPSSGSCSW